MGRRLGHPATAIALLALLVATAGGAYAAGSLISGSQIKKHSVPLNALSRAAIAALRGRTGPPGPQGAAGPAGVNGTFDPTKLKAVTAVAIPVGPGSVLTSTAQCPVGSVAVGGGGSAGIAGLDFSLPVGNPPTAWAVATANQTSVTVNLQAYAVCASP